MMRHLFGMGVPLLLVVASMAPAASAAPIVAGTTDLLIEAVQDITLLPGTPLNPGTSPVVIGGVTGYGVITLNRDAQVGTTINIPTLAGGLLYGSNPGLPGTYVFGNIPPLTGASFSGSITDVVQNTADPGYATGQPSSFQSGNFSFGGQQLRFRVPHRPVRGGHAIHGSDRALLVRGALQRAAPDARHGPGEFRDRLPECAARRGDGGHELEPRAHRRLGPPGALEPRAGRTRRDRRRLRLRGATPEEGTGSLMVSGPVRAACTRTQVGCAAEHPDRRLLAASARQSGSMPSSRSFAAYRQRPARRSRRLIGGLGSLRHLQRRDEPPTIAADHRRDSSGPGPGSNRIPRCGLGRNLPRHRP